VYSKSPDVGQPEVSPTKLLETGVCFPPQGKLSDGRQEQIACLLLRVMARQQATGLPQTETAPLLSGVERAIMEAVNALGMATPAQIVTATQMSRATVTRGLTRLIQTGALQRQGATRSARYFTTQTKITKSV
jgi:predicted HTH transcriptional regulator